MGGTQWQGLADTHIETQSHLVAELGVSYQANTICFLHSHLPWQFISPTHVFSPILVYLVSSLSTPGAIARCNGYVIPPSQKDTFCQLSTLLVFGQWQIPGCCVALESPQGIFQVAECLSALSSFSITDTLWGIQCSLYQGDHKRRERQTTQLYTKHTLSALPL